MVGQTISHYRITGKLGEGGRGVVWKAEDLHLKRVVALKFLHASDDLPRLLREAQVAASLNHPNVCTVYEVDATNGFLAMEFVEGASLSAKVGGRPLPVEQAVGLAAQIGEGLKAAHDKGIIHRDIKSGNVLVTGDGRKIAFSSDRAGKGGELWVSDADGMNPTQLIEGANRVRGSPRWSPDGRWIAFDGQSEDGRWDIFVIDAAGGQPRRVTPYPSDEHTPSWSNDGKWVYFTSDQTGRFEAWRIPFDSGKGVQLTDNGGYVPFESGDGKSLYYGKFRERNLYVRSLTGGPEGKVLESVAPSNIVPVENGVYYLTSVKGVRSTFELRFLDFASTGSRLLNSFEGYIPHALSVSPDRKIFLYSDNEAGTVGRDLMLIENYQ